MSYCGIDLSSEDLFESFWVFSNPVPVTYKISNTKFPVNTTDQVESIASSENDFGFLKVTLVTQYEIYTEGDWVELSGSAVDDYNGIFQILSVDIYGGLTLNVPFSATTSGTVQKYYQNYYTVLKLYAGIEPGHPLHSENPIELVATLYARPDSNNIATFNISEIVRNEFGFENRFCQQQQAAGESVNDINAWTSVYIAYAESYDISVAGEIETVPLDFTTDSTYYYLLNGTPQFGYKYGNNAGAYSTYNTSESGKFMTVFDQPRIFPDMPFDLSIIIPQPYFTEPYLLLYYEVKEYNSAGTEVSSMESVIPDYGGGVYRLPISDYPFSPDSAYLTVTIFQNDNGATSEISETKRINIAKNICSIHDTYISFLNYLGAWDYFLFTASRKNTFNTTVSQEIQKDVFANWDTLFAGGSTQFDYIRKEAFNRKQINSQFVTKDEREILIEWLQRSIKVMIYNPDAIEENCIDFPLWRTVLVESITDSYTDIDKLFILNFNYKETAEVFIQQQ